jgi:hypothetical protein
LPLALGQPLFSHHILPTRIGGVRPRIATRNVPSLARWSLVCFSAGCRSRYLFFPFILNNEQYRDRGGLSADAGFSCALIFGNRVPTVLVRFCLLAVRLKRRKSCRELSAKSRSASWFNLLLAWFLQRM